MNEAESDALLETIRLVRDDEGCAVLIVDHDLRLIMRLCERIHVLAEGKTICEGPPKRCAAIRRSSRPISGTAEPSPRRLRSPKEPKNEEEENGGSALLAMLVLALGLAVAACGGGERGGSG